MNEIIEFGFEEHGTLYYWTTTVKYDYGSLDIPNFLFVRHGSVDYHLK